MTDIATLGQTKKTSISTPQRPPVRGVINTTAGAVTDPTVSVIVPGHTSDYSGDLRWIRQGDALPQAGADCLIVYDETGAGTVVAWEGAGVSLVAIAAALDSRLDALEADRRVRGVVAADGSTVAGSGFTVNKTGTGQYVVTFTTAFSATPAVNPTAGTTVANYTAKLTARSASAFTVNTFTVASSPANINGEFDFIAEGPA